MIVSQDVSSILDGWDFDPDEIQVRLIVGDDGSEKIQVRVDLGLLQMELSGRPDGQRPHGFPTYFDYLQAECDKAEARDKEFELNEEQSEEADREFTQFYHRRIAWLTLRAFDKAVED